MGQGKRPLRHVRVRGKRLDEIDEGKLALALFMMVQPKLQQGQPSPSSQGAADEPDERELGEAA